MEEAAAARREMLKALRTELHNQQTNDAAEDREEEPHNQQTNDAAEDQEEELHNQKINSAAEDREEEDNQEENGFNMKFRNYLPSDKQLQEGKLTPHVLPKFEDPVATAPPPEDKKVDPFLSIAPKKPNWDLRRDVQKKLAKLEKRTQKAMIQLMEQEEKRRLAQDDGATGED